MTDRGAVCMGNPLVRFWEGQEHNRDMEEILWHRRESRRPTEKTNFFLTAGSLLSTQRRPGNGYLLRGSRKQR